MNGNRCCFRTDGKRKVIYDTPEAAAEAIAEMVAKGKLRPGEMRPYRCHCGLNPGKWLTGHARGTHKRGGRRRRRGGRRG